MYPFSSRFTQDANHHQIPLAIGHFFANEERASWEAANIVTKSHVPSYDTVGQTDITDGSKGAASNSNDFEHVNCFNCSNHMMSDLHVNCGSDAKNQYLTAINQVSLDQLERAKQKYSTELHKYFSDRRGCEDKRLYPISAYEAGYHMHGFTTEQGAESQFHAAKFRHEDYPEQVLVRRDSKPCQMMCRSILVDLFYTFVGLHRFYWAWFRFFISSILNMSKKPRMRQRIRHHRVCKKNSTN